ncbi:hypothetical protein RR47_GL001984 [Enterococcus columbae DSM 7374 = ATCC 51263]|nr:hypothetical protein RR47_GL001984 [Enterococcus columbae DSM 7374 = ATCC 51263]
MVAIFFIIVNYLSTVYFERIPRSLLSYMPVYKADISAILNQQVFEILLLLIGLLFPVNLFHTFLFEDNAFFLIRKNYREYHFIACQILQWIYCIIYLALCVLLPLILNVSTVRLDGWFIYSVMLLVLLFNVCQLCSMFHTLYLGYTISLSYLLLLAIFSRQILNHFYITLIIQIGLLTLITIYAYHKYQNYEFI